MPGTVLCTFHVLSYPYNYLSERDIVVMPIFRLRNQRQRSKVIHSKLYWEAANLGLGSGLSGSRV